MKRSEEGDNVNKAPYKKQFTGVKKHPEEDICDYARRMYKWKKSGYGRGVESAEGGYSVTKGEMDFRIRKKLLKSCAARAGRLKARRVLIT